MSVRAYILIQTDVGKAAMVARSIRQIDGVEDAQEVTGPYDVIARATTETVEELGRVVVTQIQMLEGIARTLTCPIVADS
jgi:DNA-binding Lrp family transcriptional regulator